MVLHSSSSCSTSSRIDVRGWLSDFWEQVKAIPVGYIVAGPRLQTGQTVLAGLSYYGILSAAYPGEVTLAPIVTAYAVGVAMNGSCRRTSVLRHAPDVRRVIPSATFGGSLAAYLVQKIFFTIIGVFVYLYPLSLRARLVHGEPRQRLRPSGKNHLDRGGRIVLIVLPGRIFWRQVKAVVAGEGRRAILATPKRYLTEPSCRHSRPGSASSP